MKFMDKQFGIRPLFGEPMSLRRQLSDAMSEAEFYLVVGRAVAYFVRQGVPMSTVARTLQETSTECCLFQRYADSRDSFKFRALMEGWSWKTIRENLVNP